MPSAPPRTAPVPYIPTGSRLPALLEAAAGHPLPRRPSRAVRAAAIAAAAWAVLFAVVNGWVQLDAVLDPDHPLNGHLLGAAVLNGVAVAMKLVGAVVALLALGDLPRRHAGPVLAVLSAAVVSLAGYGLLGIGVTAAEGALLQQVELAGGSLSVPGWSYPAFFLAGAAAFAGPAVHLAGRVRRARRWVLLGCTAGPVAVLGTVIATAQALVATGLLPPA